MTDPVDQNSNLGSGTDKAEIAEENGALELVREVKTRLRERDIQTNPKVIDVFQEVIQKKSSYFFKGPQPPPELLRQYEEVCPGWASRLLEMGEREQSHRIGMNSEALAQNRSEIDQNGEWIKYSSRGQVLGFLAFLVLAGICVYSLNLGNTTVAAICVGASAIGIVGHFIKGRVGQKPDADDGRSGPESVPTPNPKPKKRQVRRKS